VLTAAVMLWVGGFDVLYACQDFEHDREAGLHSIPQALGVPAAFWVARAMHLTMLVLLHRGKGGGLSSMFGGGVSSSLAGSSVAEKNLDRYTVLVGIIWFACIVGLGLWLKVAMATGAS